MASDRPGRRSKLTSSTATWAPNSLRRPRTDRAGSTPSAASGRGVVGSAMAHRVQEVPAQLAGALAAHSARVERRSSSARADGRSRGVRAPRGEPAPGGRLERREGPARDRHQPGRRPARCRAGPARGRRCRGAADRRGARSAVRVSTICPAYITQVRSHTAPARSRSWVMNSSASPRSRRSSSRIAITSAWVVTSSAVVGSSASSSRGSDSSAVAIMTRWSMPPDSSCGYCRSRVSRVVDPDLLEPLGGPAARPRPWVRRPACAGTRS